MLVNNLFVSSVNLEIYFTVMCSHLTVTSVLGPAPTLSPYFWVAQAIFEPNIFPYKYPNILNPSYSSYIPAYESWTDRVFQNVGI